MTTAESTHEPVSFDDHEEAWFAKGERKRAAMLPPEPAWTPRVDDSVADHWFR